MPSESGQKHSPPPEPITAHSVAMLSFRGRIGRLEYLGNLVIAVLVFAVAVLTASLVSPDSGGLSSLGTKIFLGGIGLTLWLVLSAGARRCHDFDRSGWYVLTSYIPVVGLVFALRIMLTSGDYVHNQYGRAKGADLTPREEYLQMYHPDKFLAPQ